MKNDFQEENISLIPSAATTSLNKKKNFFFFVTFNKMYNLTSTLFDIQES